MDGSLGSAVGRLRLDASDLERAAASADQKLAQIGKSFTPEQVLGSLQQVGTGVAAMGGGITLGFGLAVKSAATFEAGINAIQAVMAPAEWAEYSSAIKDTALRLGQDYPLSALEAAAAMEELAKQGISANDIVNGAGDGVALLANATGTDLVRSAEIAAVAMNQFGLSGSDMTNVADILTNAANASSLSVDDLGYALNYVGNSAYAAGYDLDDAATSIAMLSDRGMQGSKAGTSLRAVMQRLQAPTGRAAKLMEEMGLAAGGVNSVIDEQTGTLKPMPDIIRNISKATEHMTAVERANYLQKVFGVQGSEAMIALILGEQEALEGSGKSWADYNEEINRTGAAQQSAEIRMQGLSGALELLSGAMDTLRVRIGDTFIGPFEAVVRVLADVVDAVANLPTPLLRIVSVIGAVIGVVLSLVGALMVASPVIYSFIRSLQILHMVGGLSKALGILSAGFRATGLAATASNTAIAATAATQGGLVTRIRALVSSLAAQGRQLLASVFGWRSATTAATTNAAATTAAGTAATRATTGFRALLTALRPLAGAALLAYGAWKAWETNFLGVRTAIQSVIGVLQDFGRYIGFVLTEGDALNDWLTHLPGPIAAFAEGLGTVLSPLGSFVKAFRDAGSAASGASDEISGAAEAMRRDFNGVTRSVQEADGTTAWYYFETNADGTEEQIGKVVDSVAKVDGESAEVLIEADGKRYWATIDDLQTGVTVAEQSVDITADASQAHAEVAEFATRTEVRDGVTIWTAFRSNAEGERIAVGEIIDSYENADGMTAQVLIDAEDGPYWATIDLATGEISNAEIEVTANTSGAEAQVNTFIDRIIAGLAGFQRQMDSMGIGSWTDGFVNAATAALTVLQDIITYVSDLWSYFQRLQEGPGDVGLSAFQAFQVVLKKVTDQFPMLRSAVTAVSGVFSVLGTVLSAIGAVLNWMNPLWNMIGMAIGAISVPLAGVAAGFATFRVVFAALSVGVSVVGSAFGILTSILGGLFGPFTRIIGLVGQLPKLLTLIAAHPILAALIVLGAAAVYAYRNFEPFRNVVDAVAVALKNFATGPVLGFLTAVASGVRSAWSAMKPFAAVALQAAKALADLAASKAVAIFEDIVDWVEDAYDAVSDFIDGIESVDDAFDSVQGIIKSVQSVLSGMFDGLASKAGAFGESVRRIGSMFSNVLDAVSSFVAGVHALFSGDLTGAITNFADMFVSIWSNIGESLLLIGQLVVDAFQAIPWGMIGGLLVDGFQVAWDGIKALGSGLLDWLVDAFHDIPWGEIGSALLDGLSSALDMLADAAGAGLEAIGDAFGDVDWAGMLQSAWSVLSGAGAWIISALGDLGSSLWNWFSNAVSNIDWLDVLRGAWEVLRGAAGVALDIIRGGIALGGEVFAWMWDQISGIDWMSVFRAGMDVLKSVGQFILDLIRGGIALGGRIFAWLWEQVSGIDWMSVFRAGMDVLKSVGQFILDLIRGGIALGGRIFAWLWEQVSGIDWMSVFRAGMNVLRNVGQFILDLVKGGIALGGEIFAWLWRQVSGIDWMSVFHAALDVLKNVGQFILDKIGEGGEALYNGLKEWAGKQFQAIVDAFDPIIDSVTDKLSWLIEQMNRIPGIDIPNPFKDVEDGAVSAVVQTGFLSDNVSDAMDTINQKATDAAVYQSQLRRAFSLTIQEGAGFVEQGIWESLAMTAKASRDAAEAQEALKGKIGSVASEATSAASALLSMAFGSLGPQEPTPEAMPPAMPENAPGGSGSRFGALIADAENLRTAFSNVNVETAKLASTSPVFTLFSTAASTSFTSVKGSVDTNLVPIPSTVATMAGGIVGASLPAFQSIQSSATTRFASMRQSVSAETATAQALASSNTSQMSSNVSSNMATLASNARQRALEAQSNVTSHLRTMASNARQQAGFANTDVSSRLQTMSTNAKSRAEEANLGVVGSISAMQVKSVAQAAMMQFLMSQSMNQVKTSVTNAGNDIKRSMQTAMQGATSAITAHASNWGAIIAGHGASAASAAYSVGSNIGHSMASGMESALGRIRAAAQAMVDAAQRAVEARARIGSPSKVFMGLGFDSGDGYGLGFPKAIPDIVRNINRMMDAAINAATQPVEPTISPAMLNAMVERQRSIGLGTVPYSPGLGYGATAASGSVTNVTILTIPPDEWVRVAEHAERGGQHAQAWQDGDELVSRLRGRRR